MTVRHDADVIVAGTGPAGATAALALARAGVRVLMMERHALPRQKPCGGGISTRVLARFPWLSAALPQIPTHPVSSLYLEGPSGEIFRMQANGPVVILIRRVEFDTMLAQLAVRAGADLLAPAAIAQARQDADGVTLRTRDGRELRAPMVIAADGVNSVIARRIGMNPGWPAATPMLTCAFAVVPSCPPDPKAPISRSATRRATGISGVSQSRTANSSPPILAARSPVLSAAWMRSPTDASSSSPAAWPSVSLTILKSSRSRNRTTGTRPEASVDSSRCATLWAKNDRLASPVSASW